MDAPSTRPHDPAAPMVRPSGVVVAQGLSKREHFAALALQGLLAAPDTGEDTVDELARTAVYSADRLIAALNAPENAGDALTPTAALEGAVRPHA